jgi:hypothetical protein
MLVIASCYSYISILGVSALNPERGRWLVGEEAAQRIQDVMIIYVELSYM